MPFGLLGGRGRTCPARLWMVCGWLWMVYGWLWMVCGWLWEGRGPGMPGPYRAAAGMRAVLGRPVKAPQALLRAASSPGRGAFFARALPA